MYKIKIFLLFLSPFQICWLKATKLNSAEIYNQIQKLNLGSALYIAAHPDDENTRLISYCQMMSKREQATYH
jgi:hypothetical protein